MKVIATVKPVCGNCRVVRRHGVVMVVCKNHPATPEGTTP